MRKFLISILFILFTLPVFSQLSEEIGQLRNISYIDPLYKQRKVSFATSEEKSFIRKYNPLSLTFSSLLFVYQRFISVQISSKCSFHPSCSNFSKECIKRYGILKGVALSADRLMRCNKLAAYDIVESDLDYERQVVVDPAERYK